MTIYKFLERTTEAECRERARLVREDGEVRWEGDPEIKKWMTSASFYLFGDKSFDPKNDEHCELLEQVISGSRLWVVVEE